MSIGRAIFSDHVGSLLSLSGISLTSCNRQLEADALVASVRALEALAHERTVARLKLESDDVSSAAGAAPGSPYTLPYDPASVFLLETMVSIARQTPQHIEDVW